MNIDYENRTVTFEDGPTVKLRKLSSLVVERIQSDEKGKPQIPVQEVRYANDQTAQEANPNDPDYLLELSKWQINKSYLLMRYVLTEGIVENPPKDFIKRYKELYFPDASNDELKYMWVASFVPDQDDISLLMKAIMGQTIPTGEGLEEAAATFQGNGERLPDRTVSIPEVTAEGENA